MTNTREIEEIVESIGNLLQEGKFQEAVVVIHQELQKAREEERERIIALAEEVEVTTAFGYDPVTIQMIDLRKVQSELDKPITNKDNLK